MIENNIGLNLLSSEPQQEPIIDSPEAEADNSKKSKGDVELKLNRVFFKNGLFEMELQSTNEDIRSLLVLAELFKKSMQSGEKKRASNIYG